MKGHSFKKMHIKYKQDMHFTTVRMAITQQFRTRNVGERIPLTMLVRLKLVQHYESSMISLKTSNKLFHF